MLSLFQNIFVKKSDSFWSVLAKTNLSNVYNFKMKTETTWKKVKVIQKRGQEGRLFLCECDFDFMFCDNLCVNLKNVTAFFDVGF